MVHEFDSNKDIGIKNIVGSGKLPVEVDTNALAGGYEEEFGILNFTSKEEAEEFKEENPDKVNCGYTWEDKGPQPGLYYEVDGEDGPQVTFHMSGSYIIRADDREELESANTRVLDDMKELGVIDEDFDKEELNFTVQNVVALAKLHSDISLRALSIGLGTDAQYEPEVFPALDYSKPRYPCSFLVYANGKIISVGANSEEEVKESMEEFYEEIQEWIDLT